MKTFAVDNFSWVVRILRSSKFWVLFLGVLAAYGLDIKPELFDLMVFLAPLLWAGFTALEDYALKRSMFIDCTPNTLTNSDTSPVE